MKGKCPPRIAEDRLSRFVRLSESEAIVIELLVGCVHECSYGHEWVWSASQSVVAGGAEARDRCGLGDGIMG